MRVGFFIFTIALVITVLIGAYWWFVLREPLPGISSVPPGKFHGQTIHLTDYSNYLQNDPLWAADKLGGTKETIKGVGCTLSSVAMALKNSGFHFTPATLNAAITKHNGFTNRGWLKWASISQVTDRQASAAYYNEPDHEIINSCLVRGHYPIVKFMIKRVIPHWVVVTGRDERNYYVRDPLIRSDKAVPLTSRTKRILAVRCVGGVPFFTP